MKILHVVDSGGCYGKERVVIELLRGIPNSEAINLSSCKDFEKAVIAEGMTEPMTTHLGAVLSQNFAKQTMETEHWDIVHTHGYKESFLALNYHRNATYPYKLIRTLHGYTSKEWFSKKAIKQWVDRRLLPLHDAVVAVSQYGKYPVIYNGIGQPNCSSAGIEPFPLKNRLVLGSVGRLSPEKNYANLIAALFYVEGIDLVILGDGPERQRLLKKAEVYGLTDRLYMPGFVPDPVRYLSMIDAYIQPSITEGMPMAVLEAAACMKPMILTPVGGMKLFIDQRAALKTGTETDDLIRTLKWVRDRDISHLILNARRLYERNFTAAKMVEQYLDLYHTI